MGARLFLGNLPYTASEADIRAFFEDTPISSVKIILDKETQRSRGFGFVDCQSENVADVIAWFNGKEMLGRQIHVNQANAKLPIEQHKRERRSA